MLRDVTLRDGTIGITIGVFVLTSLVANFLFLKDPTAGLAATVASFAVWGFLLSRLLLERRLFLMDALVGVYVIIVSLALVGGLAGLLGVFSPWLPITVLGGWAIAISALTLRQPMTVQEDTQVQPRKVSLATLSLVVAFGSTITLAFAMLLVARTGRELLSPWEAIPGLFWLDIVVAFSILWILIKRISIPVSSRLLAIVLFGLVFYLLVGIVYRYGYNADIFLFQAHEKDLVASGSIGGNQIAFVHPGFEALAASVWVMTGLSSDLSLPMIIFLPALLSAFLVPYFIFKISSSLWGQETGIELSLASLAIPATFFVTHEVTRGLAAMFVLGQVVICTQTRTVRAWLFASLTVGAAIFLVHPLVGLIAVPAMVVPVIGKFRASRWYFLRLLQGTLALPFFLVAMISQTAIQASTGISLQLSGQQLSFARLANLPRDLSSWLAPVNGSVLDVVGTYYIYAIPLAFGYLAYSVIWFRLINKSESHATALAIQTWNVIAATVALYIGFFLVTNPPILAPHFYLLLHPVASYVCLPWLGGLTKLNKR